MQAKIALEEHFAIPETLQERPREDRRAIAQGKAESVNGKDVAVRADSICVHSDTPNAVEVTRAVREAVLVR